jgi:glutathione peroxidase
MTLYDISVTTIDGEPVILDAYRGRTLLIVNLASRCGFTPQYAGLEALYRRRKIDGLEILGFPCNQFGHQEPGDELEVKRFCSATYDVTFPLFSKVDVNGPRAHPLYKYLTAARRGVLGTRRIKWNFTKFLVSAEGEVFRRYAPRSTPDAIEEDLVRRGILPLS